MTETIENNMATSLLATLAKCWEAIDGSIEQYESIDEDLARQHDRIICDVWAALVEHEDAIRAYMFANKEVSDD